MRGDHPIISQDDDNIAEFLDRKVSQHMLEQDAGCLALFEIGFAEAQKHALIVAKWPDIVQLVFGDRDELLRANACSLSDGNMLFPFACHAFVGTYHEHQQLFMIVRDRQVTEDRVREVHDRDEGAGAITQHPEEIHLRRLIFELLLNDIGKRRKIGVVDLHLRADHVVHLR